MLNDRELSCIFSFRIVLYNKNMRKEFSYETMRSNSTGNGISFVVGFGAGGICRSWLRDSAAIRFDGHCNSRTFHFVQRRCTCKGRIAPTYDDCTSSVTVRLQRKSGNSWVTLRTWTASGTGTHGSSAGGTYTLTTHGTYRVYVSGTVVASDGTREPVSKSTPNKYY